MRRSTPKSLARRAPNPVGPTRSEIREAGERFKEFTGAEPRYADKVKLKTPKVGFVVGRLDGVLYETVRDGEREKYIHKFERRQRPLLVSAADGRSLHVVGGSYRFTDRGIVG